MNRLSDWYALHVITGKERAIAQRINEGGLRAIVPTRTMMEISHGTWRESEKVMLPGYVLAQASMSPRNYYALTGVPGVMRILGDIMPTSIHPEEMEQWLDNDNGGATWGLSTGHKTEEGIVIDSGPLVGTEEAIIEIDARRKRAKVKLRILNREEIVQMSLEITGSPDAAPADTSPERTEGE